jgi:hypothetical protein
VQDSESARKRQLSLADLAALNELSVEQGTALLSWERNPYAGLKPNNTMTTLELVGSLARLPLPRALVFILLPFHDL